jgi:AcrR family transcriptional regulator
VQTAAAPRPLRRDAQRNRDRIVEAAREAFAAGGIEVPVEEIARRAGVGMGTLYRRFPDKADLVDAVFEEAIEAFVQAAEEALECEDAWEGFRTYLERALSYHVENRGLKDVFAAHAHGRPRVEAVRERMAPLVGRLIERAQANGSLRRDFAPQDMPLIFWTTARIIDAAGDVAPDLWRRYLGLLLDGLRADAATPLPALPLTREQFSRCAARRR